MGINVNTVISMTFVLGSALAGRAEPWSGCATQDRSLMGLLPGIKASSPRCLVGSGTFPARSWGPVDGRHGDLRRRVCQFHYRDAVAFVILIAVLLVKPTGLFGSVTVEKV